jgi:hypothetical protein
LTLIFKGEIKKLTYLPKQSQHFCSNLAKNCEKLPKLVMVTAMHKLSKFLNRITDPFWPNKETCHEQEKSDVGSSGSPDLLLNEFGVLHGRVDQARAGGRLLQLHRGRHDGLGPPPL